MSNGKEGDLYRALAAFAVLALVLAPAAIADSQPGYRAHHVEIAPEEMTTTVVDIPIEKLMAHYTKAELQEGSYVGDEYCIACHTWAGITRDVKHRQALRTPMGSLTLTNGRGVVADYDANGVDDFMDGLDFNTISSVFDPYIPNAPILSYNPVGDTYWMTIGEVTSQVWITQGGTGDWKQRYLMRIPAKNGPSGYARENYVSPLQYNEKTDEYVAYHPEHWWDPDTKAPVIVPAMTVQQVAGVGRSYSKKCIGCHTTGIRKLNQIAEEWVYRPYPASLVYPDRPEQYPDYDRDGIADIVNVGCEACHGPGSAHILGGGDPNEILAPSDLDTEGNNEICEQCHVRVKSVPNATHDWPYNDATQTSWIPGRTAAPLESFYTDSAGRWPDAKTPKQHHQQFFSLYESSKPTFAFHPIMCVECHSPHRGGKHMVVTRIEDEGLTIATENDNNTLCLACHATHGHFEEITKEEVADYYNNLDHIGNVISAHSNHPYAPERSMGLSRCSKCHMAKTAKSAINYDIHTHTFEPIAPEKTLMYQVDGGMPNACAASCHAQMVNSFGLGYDPDIGDWGEQFDRDLATDLMYWYGPGGEWWDTTEPASMTRSILRTTMPPGRYEAPDDLHSED